MTTSNGAVLAEAIRSAVQKAVAAGTGASVAEAIAIVPAGEIGTFLHATFESADGGERELVTTALGASPGSMSLVRGNSNEGVGSTSAGGKFVVAAL